MREPRFWQRPPAQGIPVLPRLLAPAAWAWAVAGRARRKFATPARVGVPVICLGNLSAGGTGKTPLALALAARLISDGEVVHFLTRGYGGRMEGPWRVDAARDSADDVGDEPLLLAGIAPTWVSVNRADGAAEAVRAGARVIIMDDGFQNPSLHKDVSILVVDAATGLGNGRLIPAGPLREHAGDALERTSAVMIVGQGHAADGLERLARARDIPVFRATLSAVPAPQLEGASVLAFAGIGRPEKFYATLRGLGAEIAGEVSYPDHHAFTERDADMLLTRARAMKAKLVTTEKDRVRLKHTPEGSARARLRAETDIVAVRAVISDIAAFDVLIAGAMIAARRLTT